MKPLMKTRIDATAFFRWGVLLLTIAALSQACMIVRDSPSDNNGGSNTSEPDPTVIDMLVLTQLDRSSGNMAPAYSQVLSNLEMHLGERGVAVRQMALAPLHRRSSEVVPLIYGRDDPQAQFSSTEEAIGFYALDNGAQYIQQMADAEVENLAALGLDLDERAIYRPTSGDPTARAYFGAPADGLLVVVISATPRLCEPSAPDCQLDGVPPAEYFTREDADGNASWLSFSGDESLGADDVFFASIVTAEGVDSAQFDEKCRAYANFPASSLDFMQGSQTRFYRPFSESVRNQGGNATVVDLCKAISGQGSAAMESLAGKIGRAL
ncbi:MAG: hypothetical protein ACOC9W_00380 [Persicimonas sp.]